MISIIVPFYNTDKYLEECLNSIKVQTFSDYECLMIDDGSTDLSREIAQKHANEDSRFKLLNKKHIGYPLCKNLGLANAKGDYVCFIDSDDFVEKYYLENLYKAIIDTDSDISNCEYYYMKTLFLEPENNVYKTDYRINKGKQNILMHYFHNTYPWCKLFKKKLFDGLAYENVEALSDTLLLHLVYERANKVVYTSYRGYHYRIHNGSITDLVKNYSSTYWAFRLHVYITVCSYLYKYNNYFIKSVFKNEYDLCLPHLTEEQIEEFNKLDSVKLLLSA